MPDVELQAVLVATVAAFVLSGAWYAALGAQLAAARGPGPAPDDRTPAWKLAVELLRALLLAAVVAGLAARADVDDAGSGLLLGLALWVGLPLVLWVGAVVHEGTPPRVAAIHGGDWLVKLLVVGAVVAALQ